MLDLTRDPQLPKLGVASGSSCKAVFIIEIRNYISMF